VHRERTDDHADPEQRAYRDGHQQGSRPLGPRPAARARRGRAARVVGPCAAALGRQVACPGAAAAPSRRLAQLPGRALGLRGSESVDRAQDAHPARAGLEHLGEVAGVQTPDREERHRGMRGPRSGRARCRRPADRAWSGSREPVPRRCSRRARHPSRRYRAARALERPISMSSPTSSRTWATGRRPGRRARRRRLPPRDERAVVDDEQQAEHLAQGARGVGDRHELVV